MKRKRALILTRTLTSVFVATLAATDAAAQVGEGLSGAGSTPTLLVPVGAAADPGDLSALVFETSGEVPIRYGGRYAFGIGPRLVIVAQAAVGWRSHELVGPERSPLANEDAGWYPAAGLHAAWSLASTGRGRVAAIGGLQLADQPGDTGALRFGFPLGARAHRTYVVGPARVIPMIAAGVALRHDQTDSFPSTLDGSATTAGWFLELGIELGAGPLWTQVIYGFGERIGGDVPINVERKVAQEFGLQLGVSIGGAKR